MTILDNGESIKLQNYYGNLSRRRFLQIAAGVTAGSLGMETLVQEVYGAKPEGKIIVHTRDKLDRPAIVESVHPERYGRLKALEQFEAKNVQHSHVNGASIRQRSEDRTDLALQIGLNEEALQKGRGQGGGRPKRAAAGKPGGRPKPMPEEIPEVANVPEDPRQIPGVKNEVSKAKRRLSTPPEELPVEYTVTASDPTPEALEGGSPLDDDDSDSDYDGTAGLVAYDRSSSDQVLLTAFHITLFRQEMYYNGTEIDTVVHHDEANDYGQDAITYDVSSEPLVTDVLGTKQIPDVQGYWTFSGLSNATSGWWDPNIPGNFYGATSGKVEDPIDDTHTQVDAGIEYAAHSEHEVTQGGDSGGPWVDDDGYMVGHHHGRNTGWWDGWSIIAVAGPTFDAVNVTLDPNSGDPTK